MKRNKKLQRRKQKINLIKNIILGVACIASLYISYNIMKEAVEAYDSDDYIKINKYEYIRKDEVNK